MEKECDLCNGMGYLDEEDGKPECPNCEGSGLMEEMPEVLKKGDPKDMPKIKHGMTVKLGTEVFKVYRIGKNATLKYLGEKK